jgi:hypothetical protein
LKERVEKLVIDESFISIFDVSPPSLIGLTATHQELLEPNMCKLTMLCAVAHPSNIATKSKQDKVLLYMLYYKIKGFAINAIKIVFYRNNL